MPKKITKKAIKQKQKSRTSTKFLKETFLKQPKGPQKQKQKQSVNVNVNIDQSKRSSPRKPKEPISKVGGQMISQPSEGNSIRFNTQAPFYMPPPVFYQPPPPQQQYQSQQQENYALNRIERLLTESKSTTPLTIENRPIYGLSSVDTKSNAMSEAITKERNSDLLDDIYRKNETPSKFHLMDNPLFIKPNPLINPLSQVVEKNKLKVLNKFSPKKQIEEIDEEGVLWTDIDEGENIAVKEDEINIDDEGPAKVLTTNEKAKEKRRLQRLGNLPTKLEEKLLPELQKIALDLGVDINKRNHKGKYSRKTKEALILEIKEKRTNPEKIKEITNYVQNIKNQLESYNITPIKETPSTLSNQIIETPKTPISASKMNLTQLQEIAKSYGISLEKDKKTGKSGKTKTKAELKKEIDKAIEFQSP